MEGEGSRQGSKRGTFSAGSGNRGSAQDRMEAGSTSVASEGRKQRCRVEGSHLFEGLRSHSGSCLGGCHVQGHALQRSPYQHSRG